jgi:NTP pyrophosphatase (non-canonical NTP hydrolase)
MLTERKQYKMTRFSWKVFQEEDSIWVKKNFHEQVPEMAYMPLLGIIEELGELQEAKDDEQRKDAIGDIMVYTNDYCSCMSFSLEGLINEVKCKQGSYEFMQQHSFKEKGLLIIIGRLCHSHLKQIQGIRMNEDHIISIRGSLRSIIAYLTTVCLDHNLSLETVVSDVWDVVKKRDWTKNNIDGSVSTSTGTIIKTTPTTSTDKSNLDIKDHVNFIKQAFDSGAACSYVEERYDLICPTGLKRIAQRYALGSQKYSDYNWTKGIPSYIRLNHLIKHVNEYIMNGNKSDDNLAAIAWNAIALMHYEEDCKHHEAPWIEKDRREK